nr:668_t:CDS:10 [Entrophospora candida]
MGIDKNVYIAAFARTPLGGFNGLLTSFTAIKLGSIAVEANISPELVKEVFFGSVLSANLGQNPACQVALGAGIPDKVIATTVNKVCASGMKSVILGAQTIITGNADVNSMSNTPYYATKTRFGSKYGDQTLVDGIVKDGLTDVYNSYLIGIAAEECAEDYNITYEEQVNNDTFAENKCSDEIVLIKVSDGRGKPDKIITQDDEVNNLNVDKLHAVKPAFIDNGSVTAPNSLLLSDGATAIVLISGEKAKELGIKVVAKILGWSDAAQPYQKIYLMQKKSLSDIDYLEINEAFSVIALANLKLLSLDKEKVNVFGGAVAMSHPLGCSGAIIIATLTKSPVKNYFLVEAIGIGRPKYLNDEVPYQLVGLCPKDSSVSTSLERFSNGDVVRISGKFTILNKGSVLLTNVNVLPIEPQNLLSKENKINITIAANEYMDSNTKTMSFNTYVYLIEGNLIKVANSTTHGSEIFVAGNLELSEQVVTKIQKELDNEYVPTNNKILKLVQISMSNINNLNNNEENSTTR